jgi:hypothetical protein
VLYSSHPQEFSPTTIAVTGRQEWNPTAHEALDRGDNLMLYNLLNHIQGRPDVGKTQQYAERSNYAMPCITPLSPGHQTWADALIRQALS